MTGITIYVAVLSAISGVSSLTVIPRRAQSPTLTRYALSAPTVYMGMQQRGHRGTTAPIQERLHVIKIPKRYKYRLLMPGARPVTYQVLRPRLPPPPPPPPPYRYARPLPTLVSNEVEETRGDHDEEPEFAPVAVDGGESFPSFGKDSPYLTLRKPGEWTTPTPQPASGSDDAFTPVQMYYQIRQTNQVKHVPQSEALKDATTLEEVVNAPRLKELLRTTRVREVYSEEGYEDAGYDHGGHVRHAEHDEGYVAKDQGVIKVKEEAHGEDYAMPESNRPTPTKVAVPDAEPQESKISRSLTEVTSVEYATVPVQYKGEHKYSSRFRSVTPDSTTAVPMAGIWVNPTSFDVMAVKPSDTDETTPRSKYIKIITSEEQNRAMGRNVSSIGKDTKKARKGPKYNRLHAKYPKRDRYRLAKLNEVPATIVADPAGEETDDKRIILPTIGYINSLTTAHFANDKTPFVSNNNVLTTALNLTEALNYLRSNKRTGSSKWLAKDRMDGKTKKLRSKRDVDDEEEQRDEDIPDDGEEVHEEKNAEIAEEERERLAAEGEDREEYERRLREELDGEEDKIVRASLGRYNEAIREVEEEEKEKLHTADADAEVISVTTVKPVDTSKYPFYFSRLVNENSALRYATNPKNFPRKVGGGMAFYESREKLIKCPEVRPDLDDIPKRNTTLESEEDDHSRLGGLGDKIACLRSKYFDEDPLDNPLFKEKEIDYVGRTGRANNLREDSQELLKYHSSYQYQPNRTLHIMVKGRPRAETTERVIPVTEKIDEIPPQQTNITGLTPPSARRKFIPAAAGSSRVPIRSKLVIPHNCMHVIGKMAGLDGHKNLIIDCNDAILVQELRNDVRYLKIIPKVFETPKKQYVRRKNVHSAPSDWVPMMAYPKRVGRHHEDETPNGHGSFTGTTSRRKRSATNEMAEDQKSPKFPLKLSLKEFFQLLQSSNHRNRWAPKPFQLPTTPKPSTSRPYTTSKAFIPPPPKRISRPSTLKKLYVPTTPKPVRPVITTLRPSLVPATLRAEESQEEEVIRLGGQYIKGHNGQELLFVKLNPVGAGRWLVSDVEEESGEFPQGKYSKKLPPKMYKKYAKGKL